MVISMLLRGGMAEHVQAERPRPVFMSFMAHSLDSSITNAQRGASWRLQWTLSCVISNWRMAVPQGLRQGFQSYASSTRALYFHDIVVARAQRSQPPLEPPAIALKTSVHGVLCRRVCSCHDFPVGTTQPVHTACVGVGHSVPGESLAVEGC